MGAGGQRLADCLILKFMFLSRSASVHQRQIGASAADQVRKLPRTAKTGKEDLDRTVESEHEIVLKNRGKRQVWLPLSATLVIIPQRNEPVP